MRLSSLAVGALGLGLTISGALAADTKVGMSYPATGPQAYFGGSWANGAKLAVDDFNAAHPDKKVELVLMDDQGDARQGTLVAQRLCDDASVLAVIANFSSGVTIPTSDVYNRCGLAQITNASNVKVTQAGYTNLFRPIGNDAAQGAIPANYAAKELGAKTVAIIHDKGAYGQGLAEIFRDTFTADGGKVTSFQGVNPTDVDFSALLTNIKTENPDVVFFGGMMPPGALIPKQMRALGINARYISGDPIQTPDFPKIAGNGAEGAIVATQAPPYDSGDALKGFAQKYSAKFGEQPGPYSVYGYNMAKIITDALGRLSDPTRETVISEIAKTDMDSLTGHLKFTATGELEQAPMFLYEFKGTDFKPLWPKS